MKRLGSRGATFLAVIGACALALAQVASAQTFASTEAPRDAWRDVPTEAPANDGGPRATLLALMAPDWRAPDRSTSDVRRYWRGRREPRYGHRGIAGWFDVRGGFYDTQNVSKNDWTLGMKVMSKVTPQISLGLSTDLSRRTEAERVITSQYTDPTGHVVTTSSTAFDASSNLVPLMGVLEVHVPAVGVDPYFGAAGGWEFLNVHVRDFATGFEDQANYDGPGYQLFGGVGVPIGDRARFVGEAYWNGSTVTRDVIDPSTGFQVQERIGVDGGGMRAGLSFAY